MAGPSFFQRAFNVPPSTTKTTTFHQNWDPYDYEEQRDMVFASLFGRPLPIPRPPPWIEPPPMFESEERQRIVRPKNPLANLATLPPELLVYLLDTCVFLDTFEYESTLNHSPMRYLHRGETACPVAWETPYVLGEDISSDSVNFLGVDKSDSIVLSVKKRWERVKALQRCCKRVAGLCYAVLWKDVDLSHASLSSLESFFKMSQENVTQHVQNIAFSLTPTYSAYVQHESAGFAPRSLRYEQIGRILRSLPNLKNVSCQIRTNVSHGLFTDLAIYGTKLTKFVLEPHERVLASDLEWLFIRSPNLKHVALSKVDPSGPVGRTWDQVGDTSFLLRILADLRHLEVLDLCDCLFLTDESLTLLPSDPFPTLKRLLLPYNVNFSCSAFHTLVCYPNISKNVECLSAGPFSQDEYEYCLKQLSAKKSGKMILSDFKTQFANLHSIRMIEDYSFLYFATILQDEVCERIENICLFRPPGSLSPDIVTRKFGKAKRVWSCGQWGLEDGEWWDRDEDEKVLYKQFHPESNEEAECCGHGHGRRALGEGDPNILAKNAGTKAEKKIVMLNDFFHI